MFSRNHLLTTCFAVTALAGIAGAQIITVTTCFDEVDVPSTATIADLPGPDGLVSMNEALRASDNTPGIQTIGFAILPDQWWLPSIFPGQVLLQSTFGWSAQEPVVIDGTTQTTSIGDTFPGGHEMSLDGLGLSLNGDASELFGFHGCNVGLGGNNSVIHDNTGAMDISVGPFNSGNVIRDNDADTIKISYSDNNLVIRNVARRVRITGLNDSEPATGNVIGGPDPANRNFITGWGNVGEHGSVAGTTVELYYTDQTLIQNNWIGTTPDGMTIGNNASTTGVGIYSRNDNVTIRDNLIAISAHWGGGTSGAAIGSPIELQMYLGGSNIEIYGNTLGLNAIGEPVLGGAVGVSVSRYAFEYATDVRIGGPNPGQGNVIAGHEQAGILMMNGTGVPPIGKIRVSGNSIHSNGDIGIDLMPNTWDFGPTPNDPLDADVGANGLQNFPDVSSATAQGSTVRIRGSLHSKTLKDYTLEFFMSDSCHPTGFGEGRLFLGSTSVVTDAAGNAPFDVSLPVIVPVGWFVTATATREPLGRTSEFSACVAIEGPIGTSYCTSLMNSTGGASRISASGSTSIAANDLTLSANHLPSQPGIFIAGPTATQLPMFDGFLCIDPVGLQRFVAVTIPTLGVVTEPVDLSSSAAGGLNVTPGSAHYFQRWNRDPDAGGTGANFSDGVEIQYTP